MAELSPFNRRTFIAAGAAVAGVASLTTQSSAVEPKTEIVLPTTSRRILLSCKLGMIAKNAKLEESDKKGRALTLVERLQMAKAAGFDGVDFDEAGSFTVEEAREAVQESGVFVHNAINHDHWTKRLTSPDPKERATAQANIEHCIRLSHAAGGNGVLIVIGKAEDGTEAETIARCTQHIKELIPLAAALGQPILIENVWNGMMYDHDSGPDQSPDRFVEFVDSFKCQWVGMYYDIGNHWKYGQPAEWIRAFRHRCVKLDVKGYSRATGSWTDIGEGDLPWDQVRQALKDINFTGWATAEVGGGHVERLTKVRKQMEVAFGLV